MSTPSLENPVSETAYWTLASRYADATSDHPVGKDTYAHLFMDDTAREVAYRFRKHKRPFASFPVRHRVIDDLVADELRRDASMRVVVIGCGFDSRPFRLLGGRWIEVDEPSLLTIKEAKLPAADAPNELERVPISFADESLQEKLAPFATTAHVAVVLEGVLGYLPDDRRRALLATLVGQFPNHVVVCDLLTRTFLARYGRGLARFLREIGAEFTASSDHPDVLFHELGYRTVERISLPSRANELGAAGAPPQVLIRMLPGFRDGYCVWAFAHGD